MKRWLPGISAALALALPARADDAFKLSGTLRNTTVATRNYPQPVLFGSDSSDGLDFSSLRLIAQGRPKPWLSFEVHGLAQLLVSSTGSTQGQGVLFGGAGASAPYRIDSLSWNFSDRPQAQGSLSLDRANVKLSAGPLDVTVGRQAISFGKTYFWNPLDEFLPFGSTQFDRDYKAGVDAIRADWALGDFSGLDFVAATGDLGVARPAGAPSLYADSALLLRAFTSLGGWDLAAQGGKVRGGYEAGAGASGEIGPLALRAEAAYFAKLADDPVASHLSAVVGVGHRFESSLDLQAEYFYNGGRAASLAESFLLIAAGRLQQANLHLFGAVASYQLHPLVVGSLAAVVGAEDGSGLLQPGVTWSAGEEVEVVAGAALAFGKRPAGADLAHFDLRSEFGAYPDFVYVQLKLYF